MWKKTVHVCFRGRGSKANEKEDVTVGYTHDLDFDEGAYAYINPKDINDDFPYEKTSTPDDYTRLGINGRVNADYSKLKGMVNIRSEKNPALPERYNNHQGYDPAPLQLGPYQTLKLDKRYEKDYDKLTTPLEPSVKPNINT